MTERAVHTAGPWKADTNHGCKRISAKPYGQHRQAKRMEVACTPGLYSEPEDMANARLIAAAPTLLEALTNLHERIADAWPELFNLPPMEAARLAIAIATARGEG